MRMLLAVLCLWSALATASEGTSPVQVIENYFASFNSMDRSALNAASGHPFVFILGGEPTAYPRYGDAVDFDGLQSSGWSYSRLHKSELVYEDDLTAMVKVNFSRYDTTDRVISTADVVYLLVLREGVWKVKAGVVNGNLTLGKD